MRKVSAPGYHATLTLGNARMMDTLPPAYRASQLAHIQAIQNPDGGFSGRTQASDPYYTSFALRSAAILGCVNQKLWQGAARYLRTCVPLPTTIVDSFNLLHSIQITETHGGDITLDTETLSSIEALLDSCVSERGGFGIIPKTEASVYQTFLATLCYQMLGSFPQSSKATLDFLTDCRCRDGGFTDKRGFVNEGGTNPTSAAVAVLHIHGALESRIGREAAAFISSMQRDDGGLAAHHSAPASDLMSTYTGLLALDKLDASGEIKLGPVGRFVRETGSQKGGFHATTGDTDVDLEYTYYGLGTLALLTALAMPQTTDCLNKA